MSNLHGHSTFGSEESTITCTAPSTCDNSSAASPPRAAEYFAAREKADAEYAIKVAQNLMISTAAFSCTNDPATTTVPVPPSPPRVSLRRPYKALVVLFMGGGADTFNMVVPHSNCDARNVSTQCAPTAVFAPPVMRRHTPLISTGARFQPHPCRAGMSRRAAQRRSRSIACCPSSCLNFSGARRYATRSAYTRDIRRYGSYGTTATLPWWQT
jgi:hypothetical protein